MKQNFEEPLKELRTQVIEFLKSKVDEAGGSVELKNTEIDKDEMDYSVICEELFDCPVFTITDDYTFNSYYLHKLELRGKSLLAVGHDIENNCDAEFFAEEVPLDDLVLISELIQTLEL